jgi:hydroxypyruvate isomerase
MKINHSVCYWCYEPMPLETLCIAAKSMGITSIDLVKPEDVPLLKKHGLACAMIANPVTTAPSGQTVGIIEAAWNRPEYHDCLVEIYLPYLASASQAGAKNVICFPGNRDGMDDQTGLKNCAAGIKRLIPTLEQLGLTLTMELLNSAVDHPDYMCDHTAWGVELCDTIGSENFKLLYDIYHMQIMDGNVIATIRKYHRYFSHYHTGGVPGRNEIDETQELNYPAIMRAIAETGYQGFVAQEFVPTHKQPLESLKKAIEICTV